MTFGRCLKEIMKQWRIERMDRLSLLSFLYWLYCLSSLAIWMNIFGLTHSRTQAWARAIERKKTVPRSISQRNRRSVMLPGMFRSPTCSTEYQFTYRLCAPSNRRGPVLHYMKMARFLFCPFLKQMASTQKNALNMENSDSQIDIFKVGTLKRSTRTRQNRKIVMSQI